ncbi:uncharacterized protein MELLADRAFT_115154 [Melampsora larici-populina 98AG31]|uniref:Uncharacterized protein n=1 Tax=Melampsora larici-populina (strain 98AG31 / pathotype 3-4-7) TaxID=747676 RepID=F4R5W9_MELLP|nr:uncharacterized protein MELLADRAFT_115154 [Melampsora larici-populina 98AG31]EGG12181.1 hypothetical protein MELLADRAFT_115154 [Melampsora larici-populina 98AG31]
MTSTVIATTSLDSNLESTESIKSQLPPAQLLHHQMLLQQTDEEDDTSSLENGEIRGPAGPQDPNALITVFSSQTEFNVKHPLYSTWTLWFDNASKNDKAKNRDELIQRVIEVESVEDLYHNMVPPSLMDISSNYYLSKQGIKRNFAAWEDPSNHKGGKWCVQPSRDKNRETIDKWWLYTTKALAENVGRHFKYGVLGMPEGKKLQVIDIGFHQIVNSKVIPILRNGEKVVGLFKTEWNRQVDHRSKCDFALNLLTRAKWEEGFFWL